MSHTDEYEIFRLSRLLGPSKIKTLLQIMYEKNIGVEDLLTYLESVEYKVPSFIERRIEDLERRIALLEGKRKKSIKKGTDEESQKFTKREVSVDVNLTEVRGIGPKRSKQLKEAGLSSVNDLAFSEAKDLAEKTGVSEDTTSKWIKNAKELLLKEPK